MLTIPQEFKNKVILPGEFNPFFCIMKSIITVFKEEFLNKDELLSTITEMSDEVALVAGAYVISTKPGHLFDVLNLLKMNKISYGTHFNP
jgi:hypothetical protein